MEENSENVNQLLSRTEESEPLTIIIPDKEDPLLPARKLKQDRLPFKSLVQKPVLEKSISLTKKRKLSEHEIFQSKSSKILKSLLEDKNKCLEKDSEVSSSSEAENIPLVYHLQPKINTLDKFLLRNGQNEIISSSKSDIIDFKNSDVQFANIGSGKENSYNKLKFDSEKLSEEKSLAQKGVFHEDCRVKSPRYDVTTSAVSTNMLNMMKYPVVSLHRINDVVKCSLNKCRELSSDHDKEESKLYESSTSSPTTSTSNDQSATDTPTEPTLKVLRKKERNAHRQKIKEERERQKLMMKERKAAERAEKLKQRKMEKEEKKRRRLDVKLQKEKEKQEKRQQQEKEKFEKLQQKEEEKRIKQELLDLKNEERKKREEERRQKEEEKQKEEEEMLRKQKKAKEAFQSFFIKEKTSMIPKPKDIIGLFMPFEVKKNMHLAPYHRTEVSEMRRNNFDYLIQQQHCTRLYLRELKSRQLQNFRSRKSWLRDVDAMLLEYDSEVAEKMTYRVKLLQFHTNYRPPYYGTWRKTSKILSPRNPWKQDINLFDYDVDSDDEWEEEEPGESISCSEGEDEKDEKDDEVDDDDENDGWMVPHGYLSEGEGCEDDEGVTPELLKARQLAKAEAWERALKEQCRPLKPLIVGCFWEGDTHKADILDAYKAVMVEEQLINTSYSSSPQKKGKERNLSVKKRPVPEHAMVDLITYIHGSSLGIKKLIKGFQVFWKTKMSGNKDEEKNTVFIELPENNMETDRIEQETNSKNGSNKTSEICDKTGFEISKRQLEKKILDIAVREKRPACHKICWYVHKDALLKYGLEILPLKPFVNANAKDHGCASNSQK